MDKVITTVLLTISAMIAATMIATRALPMLSRGIDSMTAASTTMESRIKTSVSVVHATADQAENRLYVWVKNIGSIPIDAPERSDLFLQTPGGAYDRLPYGSGTGKWQYALQDGSTAWTAGSTIKVTISLAAVAAGQYQVALVTPNGVGTQSTFSV